MRTRTHIQVMSVTAGVTLIVASCYSYIFREDIEGLCPRLKKTVFRLFRKLPFVKAKISREMSKSLATLSDIFLKETSGEVIRDELPAKGMSREDLLKELDTLEGMGEIDWEAGRVSGGLYNCNPELSRLNETVYGRFLWTNPLHPDVFPYVRKMEAEVVRWCCNLFHGGEESCGTMTSGGSESIMLAMKAYRQIGYEKGIRYPEIVVPATAHAAFMKAGEFFRMKVTRVPVDPHTCTVNLKAMARAISKDTIVVVGSAPPYPHGVIDPIQDIARLARSHGVYMHVDACLGGFLIAFMEKAGFPLEPFDFRVKGVTSISADTHKFGYCPKGTSVIMYSSPDLRHRQYFSETSWPGGIYATPILAGSRPGSLIASTWATMLFFGLDGYVEETRKVIETTRWIMAELRKVPGIYIMGSPQVAVFAMASKDFNIYQLNSTMIKKGWNLNALQFPPALHLCVTILTTKEGVAKKFVEDVKEATAELLKHPTTEAKGSAAMYGASQAVADRSIVQELTWGVLDLFYTVKRADE